MSCTMVGGLRLHVLWLLSIFMFGLFMLYGSVANPNPDPPDPHVFGPPGSGSGPGSGSFCHQAKIVRKTLIPTALWPLFDFLSLKMMQAYIQKVISKKTCLKNLVFLLPSWRSMTKIAGSGSINKRHGSADPDPDPDPLQNVMDPQHCFMVNGSFF